jgi:hypothetical protein
MTRLGARVALSENYGYYEGAFDDLLDYLAMRGISPLPLIADVYHSESPFTGHHHEYTVGELVDVLSWSGLSVDEVVTLNYTPWPDRRLLRRIAADWPRKRFAGMREVLLACASRAPD